MDAQTERYMHHKLDHEEQLISLVLSALIICPGEKSFYFTLSISQLEVLLENPT